MTILHRFVRLIVLIVLAVIGLEVLINASSAVQFDGFLGLLLAERPTVFWLGVCLFLLALLFALSGVRRKDRGYRDRCDCRLYRQDHKRVSICYPDEDQGYPSKRRSGYAFERARKGRASNT